MTAKANIAFCEALSSHCCQSDPSVPLGMDSQHFSEIYCHFDGEQGFLDRNGLPMEIRLSGEPNRPFIAGRSAFKLHRVAALLNHLSRLGYKQPVHSDMEDARMYGDSGVGAPRSKVLVFNRRPNTRNLVLWPLHRYHTPGSPFFISPNVTDTIPFDEKLDCAVWRGGLTGTQIGELFDSARRRMPAWEILWKLIDLNGQRDESLLEFLRGLPRYNLVQRYFGSADIDARLTLGSAFVKAAEHPFIEPYVDEFRDYTSFYRYRYIISVSGYDAPSNFPTAAFSNSVVLKEEDGWEVFYSFAFRPWEHYIPLSPGALDIEEKLAWARRHPSECKLISLAAREAFSNVMEPANRATYLRMILEQMDNG